MNCPKCNAEIESNFKFCMQCGTTLITSTAVSHSDQLNSQITPPASFTPPKKKRHTFRNIALGFIIFTLLLAFLSPDNSESIPGDPTELTTTTTNETLNTTEVGPSPTDSGDTSAEEISTEATTTPTEEATSSTEQTEPQDPYYIRAYEIATLEYPKYLELQEENRFTAAAYENAISLDMLYRQPQHYEDKEVYFGGFVIQTIYTAENPSMVELRLEVASAESESNTIYVTYTLKENEPRILEGDYIDLYGISKGLITYEAVLGNSITIPYIEGVVLYTYSSTNEYIETPAMEQIRQLLAGNFLSSTGNIFSFTNLEEHPPYYYFYNEADYGDCVVVYFAPYQQDAYEPLPIYRIVAFDDGTVITFEPDPYASDGIASLDDGVYTKYTIVY